jgi:glutathione synthase/RimK-type ligase-like ATP-grasp enzyme
MQTIFDVTLVTYDTFPNLTDDDRILLAALEANGMRTRAAVWSDASVDWSLSPITVLRSPWDYFRRIDEFKQWLDATEPATTFINSADVVRWNMHKSYLRDLAARGVPVVPTHYVEQGLQPDIHAICERRGWREIVIKPCIGGSAYLTKRFAMENASPAVEHLKALTAIQDAMIQPYLPAVESSRERALVFIGGAYSHAGLKAPFNAGPAGGEKAATPFVPAQDEVDFASTVIAALDALPDYARVDFVVTGNGPLVMEVELIEPALYFSFRPEAAGMLAHILIRRCREASALTYTR